MEAIDDIEELRKCFAVHDEEIENNVGKKAWYNNTPGYKRYKVEIVGVQKIWDHDEKGQYVFGIHGYTVRKVRINTFKSQGKTYQLHPTFACSKKDLIII